MLTSRQILQQLLQLPPTFHIRKAKVALLRVTLPVDIYSSPIQIQVTGVDVQLRISKDGSDGGGSGHGGARRGSRQDAGDNDDDVVPTAADLAQSFLEQQPSNEKKALEDALAAAEEDDEYYDDDDSTSSSSQTLGTGQALTLPAFLAGFLQGIVDRIQVNIEGVTFQLEVDVPVDTASAPPAGAPSTPTTPTAGSVESVTFQLALSRINIEGVTTAIGATAAPAVAGDDSTAPGGASQQPPIVPKGGKRHISLENVRAFLISEANVFSTLARSSSMLSSLSSRSPSIPSRAPSSRSPAASMSGFRDYGNLADDDDDEDETGAFMAQSGASSAMIHSQYPLQDSEDAFNIPYEMGSSGDENESTTRDAPGEGDLDPAGEDPASRAAFASSSSTPRASVHGEMSGLATTFSSMFPPKAHSAAQSTLVHDNDNHGSLQWSAWNEEAQSEPSLRRPRVSAAGLGLVGQLTRAESSVHSGSGSGSDGPAGPSDPADDLTESHLYSHEEAESMYMSAFSQAQSVRLQTAAMPGSWDTEDDVQYDAHENTTPIGLQDATHDVFSSAFGDRHNPDQSTQLPAPRAALDPEQSPAHPESPTADRPSLTSAVAPEVQEPSPDGLPPLTTPDNTVGLDASMHTAEPSSPGRDDSNDPAGQEARSQADEAATPRGPARLVKEIVALQYISIYVSSSHKQIDIAQPPSHSHRHHAQNHERMGQSVAPHLPGAFSVYSSAGTFPTPTDASVHSRMDESQMLHGKTPESQPVQDQSVEVTLAPLEIRFDASIGFLLAMVVSELMQSLKAGLQQQQEERQKKQQRQRGPPAAAAPQSQPLPDIKFHAEKISLLFLDKLAGVADTAERFFESPRPSSFNQSGDVLLQTVLEELAVSVSRARPETPTGVVTQSSVSASRVPSATSALSTVSIDLKRFRFGYADADIVSFDRRIQMRASVRDVFPPAGDDVSVKITQSTQAFRCDINTLPLLVSVDLQRLDETFSWFGGLSSFLSMGSSISSAASQGIVGGGGKLASPAKTVASSPQKARGVRFDAPINPDDKSAASENKLDMRIGGVRLDLIGRDCSIGLDTSAVKLVSREEGIGVGVSRIRLAGPYLRNSRGDAPVTAEASNTRFEFMNVPKDKDLERLLELITPSRVNFDEREDVIMVDTLLRQRRSGPLLRLSVDDFNVQARNLAQLSCLPSLGEEIARLATVAKYLPEDDRPGLLTLGLIRRMDVSVDVSGRLGLLQASMGDFEMAHITIPSLVSVAVGSMSVHRNHIEELIGSTVVSAANPPSTTAPSPSMGASAVATSTAMSSGQSPALMLRIIGDDMEPVIKVKMWGLNFEYRVPTIMDVLGLAEDITPQDFEASLAASVANLGEHAHSAITGGGSGGGFSGAGADPGKKDGGAKDAAVKPTVVDLSFRDCVVGLNPLGQTSKLDVVLVDARLEVTVPQADEEIDAVVHLNKMALLLIDDVSNVTPMSKEVAFVPGHAPRRSSGGISFLPPPSLPKDMVSRLCASGFVDICQISAAKVSVHVSAPDEEGQKTVDLEVRDDLLVLETCADSTQTLITLANALKPPTPPSKEIKFKTEVMPVKDLLASISIDAFGRAEGNYNFDDDFILEEEDEGEDTGGYLGGFASDDNLYEAGGSDGLGGSHLLLTDQGNRAVEQSVASLPSVSAGNDDDLLLDDSDLDDLDVEEGMTGTVAEQLFNASSIFSERSEISERTERASNMLHSHGSLANRHALGAQKGKGKLAVSPIASSVSELGAEENFFGTASDTAVEESAHANRWNSARNIYDKGKAGVPVSGPLPPLRVRVRDVHVIWNLYDGYDWQHTRDIIAKTVEEVEARAYERRTRHRRRSGHDQYSPYPDDDEEEAVIGDFLFNSIYIGIPATHDPRELTQAINQNIYGDATGDTESIAATTITATSSRTGGGGAGGHSSAHPLHRGGRSQRKLKLKRSRRHKITFELGGVAADLVVYPPGSGETQSSIDVRVRDLDVFDHIPTSTWKKFATYDRDAGERPIDGDMVHLEVLVVKPVPELAATEFVLKVSVLPLRLHVDQDALDFITRFFEFKDDSAPPTHASPSDIPFIQRAEIRNIPVQLDFKPKRVDYAGLRSGHTTEFMNFLILDGSRMTMRHTIIYGISGFDRLGKTLNDIWMPDIKRHQLPGVLAGLAPVRSLVTVGSGFKDLIEIPIQEYRHNGRIVRSISKGAMAFAKSTGTELVSWGPRWRRARSTCCRGPRGC